MCLCGLLSSSAQTKPYVPENIQDGVILHCFVWPLQDVIEELPAIAEAGFTAVQISPMQAPNVAGQVWYSTYGPIDYAFYENVLGTRADLEELCRKAGEYGIKVIMDVCPNHLMHDGPDKNRAPEQYAVDWWRHDGRIITDQGTVKWDSRWSFTNQNVFGHEIVTSRTDVQERMRRYLADLYSMGVRGIRWDSAKHIAVPSEGDNFWPAVTKDCGMWTYAEILGDIDYAPQLMGEYIDVMSVTDPSFDGRSSWSWLYSGGMPRQRSVYWSESHDTFSNGQDDSQKISQNDIDRRWALVASRRGATALYFSRPGLLPKDDIKLAVKGSTHFSSPEVSAVNHFHNLMGAEPEEFYNSNGVVAVYRRKGVVIVSDEAGHVEIPVKNLLADQNYVDQITGNTFVISGDKIVGDVGSTRIAVVYDASQAFAPLADMSIWPQNSSFTGSNATYTLTPAYCAEATVTIDGASPVTISAPTKFTIGDDVDYGRDITIRWQGGDGERAASGEFVITKVDPSPTYVFMHSDSDWSALNAYMFMYDDNGMIGQWPGVEMSYDEGVTIDGKSGWWVCEIPDRYKLTGRAMVSTSGSYRYPASNEPGIPVEGKSIAFEYVSGAWSTKLLDHVGLSDDEHFVELTTGLPETTWGSIRRFKASCPELDDAYTVDVLLPEGYDPDRAEGYPVIYTNDGQGLFDDALSFIGHSWNLDNALEKLAGKGLIAEPIIVGIHNRGTLRPSDYIPEKPCTQYIAEDKRTASGMWTVCNGKLYADEYVRFLATTLKQNIDRTFNTDPDRGHTFMMGSSMGALSALYAMCEYPTVFGGAVCISTHWIGDFNYDNVLFPEAMAAYLRDNLPSPDGHKLYFDRGTIDLDAAYAPWEPKMHAIAQEKGYGLSEGTLLTYTAEGASHNEIAWAARVDRPLYFMLGLPGTDYDPDKVDMFDFHVMFRDSRYPWSSTAVFTFSSKTGALHMGNWPGTKMSPVCFNGQNMWEVKFSHFDEPTHIIFNDGKSSGAVQTADLLFYNNYIYNFDGAVEPIATAIAPVGDDGSLKVSVSDNEIIIRATKSCKIMVHELDGRSQNHSISAGENRVTVACPGIYIISAPDCKPIKVAVMPK